MRRGDIYIADLPEPVGSRPVLLVTRTAAIAVRSSVTVAPVTRTRRQIARGLPLARRHGVRQRSVANCDSLMTIRKDSLRPRRVGSLDVASLVALDRALRYALEIRS